MNVNSSLDFLKMIKAQTKEKPKAEPVIRSDKEFIAVIDTETNWRDEVMSIGVALSDMDTYRCVDKRYYILEPEWRIGGFYSGVIKKGDTRAIMIGRVEVMEDLERYLLNHNVKKILAYNARFDLGHLPELNDFEWFDIMRVAAYRQHNPFITDDMECCKTGRLKGKYGVEAIMQMITGDSYYRETHNAVIDACDELKIVELLGLGIEEYECGRL